MNGCADCLLRMAEWPGAKVESSTGFCIWFLRKLKVPRPIPADVYAKGCANYQDKKLEKMSETSQDNGGSNG